MLKRNKLAVMIILTILTFGTVFAAVYSNLHMTGRGGRPATAKWIPEEVDWGYAAVGEPVEKTVQLKNIGKFTLNGLISLSACQDNVYTIISGGGIVSVPPGDSVDVTVRFAPADTTTVYDCYLIIGPPPANPYEP